MIFRRLDCTRQDAGEENIGAHSAGRAEVVTQGFGLAAAERRQAGAALPAGDRTVEAGVRITVTHQDQLHVRNRN